MTNFRPMNKKLKTKWLRALKSGKYNHTAGSYRSKRGFYTKDAFAEKVCHCSVGVLIDITNPNRFRGIGVQMYLPGGPGTEHLKTSITTKDLSPTETDVVMIEHDLWSEITELNDNSDSYEPVIKFIEENL